MSTSQGASRRLASDETQHNGIGDEGERGTKRESS
jgi:hypothetical protein